MSTTYKVQHLEKKRSSKGKEFLTLKLNDVFVQFFDEKDVQQSVEVGQTVQCNLEQKGKFWNGKDLRVSINGVSSNSPASNNSYASTLSGTQSIPVSSTKKEYSSVSKQSANYIPISLSNPTVPSNLSETRNTRALHNLSIPQLEELYTQSVETGDITLGTQISYHIRMARQITLLEQIALILQNFKK